jgi:hypothetical protein
MNLHDDWVMEHVTHDRRIWTLALYAAHLATGSTLMCKSIRAATIETYIRDNAKFIRLFIDRDPRKVNDLDGKLAPPIRAVIDMVKRLESMRDLREPFTWEMWLALDTKVANADQLDSLDDALCDWFGKGLYSGPRLSEWAQHDTHALLGSHLSDEQGVPLAFDLSDLEFRGLGNKRVTLRQALSMSVEQLERAIIRFSHQKNGEHGEKRHFTRNTGRPDRCCVRFLHRIFCRFIRLLGWTTSQPLSVYKAADGTIKNIVANDISTAMRALACQVYNLDPVKDKDAVQRWSSHSLRVGACVILHTMGFSAVQIQFLLRWKSTAFMNYLRNLAILSDSQNRAMADLSTMPHII